MEDSLIGEAFVEILMEDFKGVLGKNQECLCDDSEYMQLTELRFLLKNIRELIDVQLYQAYSRSDTINVPVVESQQICGTVSSPKGNTRKASNNKGKAVTTVSEAAQGDKSFTESKPAKRIMTDRRVLAARRKKLDENIKLVTDYINERLTLTQLKILVR
jgi:hypothetical protein